MVLLLSLLAGPAQAGAGDPEAGTPSWAERELHVWANAARIAPQAFPKDAADGGCSATTWASAPPVQPLRFHAALYRVARAHSADLDAADAGLSHDSTDGTTMVERIQPVYGTGKAFGENLAFGYATARRAVLSGWMCSDGHRHNLLDARYDEVGYGVVGDYMTQDLGDGGGEPELINGATHFPHTPTADVTITTDLWHPSGQAPDALEAIVDGEAVPLFLLVGADGQGIYQASTTTGPGCTPWFIEARFGQQVVRWPETGSYAWGACDFDDVGAEWLDLQVERGEGPFDPDGEWTTDGGTDDTDVAVEDRYPYTNLCATSPTNASAVLLLLGILGVRRRRSAR